MLRRLLSLFVLVSLLSISASAQFPGFGKKKTSDKPTEVSEADKQTMAEIAQRPEIQASIDAAWGIQRKKDLIDVYLINQTANWAVTDDPITKRVCTPNPYHTVANEAIEPAEFCARAHLYNNPLMQIYLNNIGQRLVPKDSPNLYTFRVMLDPIPSAFGFTTGSVYISTGLLSMVDDEAQLSYILAHEIAHIELKHRYKQIRNEIVEAELNREKEVKAARTSAMITAGAAVAGGLIGGLGKGGVIPGALVGGVGGIVASSFLVHANTHDTQWEVVDEDEADAYGAKYMLDQGYDVREVPRLYATLDRVVAKDERVGLGFMGDKQRVIERKGHIQKLIAGDLKDKIAAFTQGKGLLGSSSGFAVMLAAAKRDNGILALQYDLFAEARQNFEDALIQRSTDPALHFYLAQVMSLTAKTPDEQREAVSHISDALRLDTVRGAIPDLHLQLALSLLVQDNTANKEQIISELKTYVTLFQRDNGGELPKNMPAIFDYFNLVGEPGWYLPPDWYPATQLSSAGGTIAPAVVVRRAVGTTPEEPAEATAGPKVKPVSAAKHH